MPSVSFKSSRSLRERGDVTLLFLFAAATLPIPFCAVTLPLPAGSRAACAARVCRNFKNIGKTKP
ncbi:hypothetical protein [Methanimicrococcus stummii]|uniref:hypothetical protein n=1 Tax=Methanimicrococcus stummii TaxID=3028294 RepID=UPI00293045A9|nr:hypothetical protein [Methanimicrococcus sp. Es2]